MGWKISGYLEKESNVIILDETDYSVEHSATISGGNFEIDGLTESYKTILARTVSDGQAKGFGNVYPINNFATPWTDDFTGTSLDSTLWNDRYLTTPATHNEITVQSGYTLFNYTNTDDKYAQMDSKFSVSGDFDIQAIFNIPGGVPTYSESSFAFWAEVDGTHFYQLVRQYHNAFGGQSIREAVYADGWVINSATAYTNNSDIRFRLTRTGSTWTGYYWGGSSWTALSSTTTVGTGNVIMKAQIYSSNSSTPDWSVQLDSVSVVTGDLIEP